MPTTTEAVAPGAGFGDGHVSPVHRFLEARFEEPSIPRLPLHPSIPCVRPDLRNAPIYGSLREQTLRLEQQSARDAVPAQRRATTDAASAQSLGKHAVSQLRYFEECRAPDRSFVQDEFDSPHILSQYPHIEVVFVLRRVASVNRDRQIHSSFGNLEESDGIKRRSKCSNRSACSAPLAHWPWARR